MKMRTYEQIEAELIDKIIDIKNGGREFTLYIGSENGLFADMLYCGLRKLFEKDWILIGNDCADDSESDCFMMINPEDIENCICNYKTRLKEFISKYGFKSNNYYTFKML